MNEIVMNELILAISEEIRAFANLLDDEAANIYCLKTKSCCVCDLIEANESICKIVEKFQKRQKILLELVELLTCETICCEPEK